MRRATLSKFWLGLRATTFPSIFATTFPDDGQLPTMGRQKRPKRGSGGADQASPPPKRFAVAEAPSPAPVAAREPAEPGPTMARDDAQPSTATTMTQAQPQQHGSASAPAFCWWQALRRLCDTSTGVRQMLAEFMKAYEPPSAGRVVTVPTEDLITALHTVLLATPPTEAPEEHSTTRTAGTYSNGGCSATVLPLLHAYRPAMVPILASCVQRRLAAAAAAAAATTSDEPQPPGGFDLRGHERLGYVFTLIARVLARTDHVLLLLDEYYQAAPSPFERVLQSARSGGELEPSPDEASAYLDIVRTANNLLGAGYRGGAQISWAPLFTLLRCGLQHSRDFTESASTSGGGGGGSTGLDVWADIRWYAARCVAQLLAASPGVEGGAGGAAAGLGCDSVRHLSKAGAFEPRPPEAYLEEEETIAAEHALAAAAVEEKGGAGGGEELRAEDMAQWVGGLTLIADTVLPTNSRRRSSSRSCTRNRRLSKNNGRNTSSNGGGQEPGSGEFVNTAACQDTLRAIAMAMAAGKPVVLEGPPGTGKTALLDELARRCGHAEGLIRIHLDDQLDSKVRSQALPCTRDTITE